MFIKSRIYSFVAITILIEGAVPATAAELSLSRLLDEANAKEQELTTALRVANDGLGRITELTQQINVAQRDKNSTLASQLSDELFAEYPTIMLIYKELLTKDGEFTTDQAVFRAALASALREITAQSMETCFDRDRGIYRSTSECKTKLAKECARYGSIGDGHLHATTLSENLELINVPVNTSSELAALLQDESAKPDLPESLRQFVSTVMDASFFYCQAASLAGEYFDTTDIVKYPLTPPATRVFWPPTTLESFDSECFAIKVFDIYGNFTTLQRHYPKFALLKAWEPEVKGRAIGCRRAVQKACKHTYEIGGEIVLAYVTKGCDIREVTGQDIDEDIDDFALLGVTHAERIKHAQLKDTIILCKQALDAGFVWDYVEPPRSGCSQTKPSATRKKGTSKPKKAG